ncbi:MAG: MFS transporter [Phycisphaerales bacterium]
MTTLGAVSSIPLRPEAARTADLVRARLIAVCASHAVVDLFSALVIPILSVLEGRLTLTPTQGAVLVALGSFCSGAVQPLVAWASDRFDTRLLGTLGFVLAVLAIGCVGFARDYTQLVVIQIVGAIGVGAFHPVSAAAVGQLSGRRRSAGVAAFFTAGMIGGIAGFWGAPAFVRDFGVEAYAWLIPGGLVFCGVLAWASHGVPHRTRGAGDEHAALSADERRRRWWAVGVLYTGNMLRFTVNMALVYLLIRWAEDLALARAGATELTPALRSAASQINGPMQAAMAVGMGVSGLAAGLVRTHHEKLMLVLVPAVGAIAVAAFPHAGTGQAWILAMLAGVAYAGVIPITISLAQRLLPHRTSLASGLMMGGAWAPAAAGAPIAEWLVNRTGLETAFHVVAGMLLLAALTGMVLSGKLIRRTAGA